ncbi:hypothetical protein PWT90_09915 [Aphanocladium album]|nr:hypothetical protein PWT90_09915 [Aphanocladium album]
MIPLISFDAVVNVRMQMRDFAQLLFGPLSAHVARWNLSVLMALNGEPGWVCLMCCNCDILFSAIVIQWVTSKDNAGTSTNSSLGAGHGNGNSGPHVRPATAPRDGSSPCRSFSPCLLDASSTFPSTPAEFSLTTNTTRCCSHAGAGGDLEYDAESCDSTSTTTAAKMLSAAAGHNKRPTVLVTTTIERETAPIGAFRHSPASLSHKMPHKLLGGHRNSHVDTAVAAAASAEPPPPRRSSRGLVPWGTVYMGGYPADRRSP